MPRRTWQGYSRPRYVACCEKRGVRPKPSLHGALQQLTTIRISPLVAYSRHAAKKHAHCLQPT